MMKLLFFGVMVLMPLMFFGQGKHVLGAEEQLEMKIASQHADIIKKLEKETGCSFVYPNVEEDGFWYFKMYGKNDNEGVADTLGNIVVPVRYKRIEYVATIDEGYSKSPYGNDSIWHKKTPASYIVSDYYFNENKEKSFCIYSTDGSFPMVSIKGEYSFLMTGYISVTIGHDYVTKKQGLYTTDGIEILPVKYQTISCEGKVCHMLDVGSGLGTERGLWGAAMLDKSLPDVSCRYSYPEIRYNEIEKCWMEKNRNSDKWEKYDPAKHPTTRMEDLYEGYRYYNCILEGLSHSKNGTICISDKYYIGISIYQIAFSGKRIANNFIHMMKNKNMDNKIMDGYINSLDSISHITRRERMIGEYIDIDFLLPVYRVAYAFLDSYVKNAEQDNTETDKKEKMISDAQVYMRKIQKEKAEVSASSLEYNNLWSQFEAETKLEKPEMQKKWCNDNPSLSYIIAVATAYGIITPDTNLYEFLMTDIPSKNN